MDHIWVGLDFIKANRLLCRREGERSVLYMTLTSDWYSERAGRWLVEWHALWDLPPAKWNSSRVYCDA
jgi:hypothetical protein